MKDAPLPGLVEPRFLKVQGLQGSQHGMGVDRFSCKDGGSQRRSHRAGDFETPKTSTRLNLSLNNRRVFLVSLP